MPWPAQHGFSSRRQAVDPAGVGSGDTRRRCRATGDGRWCLSGKGNGMQTGGGGTWAFGTDQVPQGNPRSPLCPVGAWHLGGEPGFLLGPVTSHCLAPTWTSVRDMPRLRTTAFQAEGRCREIRSRRALRSWVLGVLSGQDGWWPVHPALVGCLLRHSPQSSVSRPLSPARP